MTRKYEFAYPGEIFHRIFCRVHALNGPIYTYADLTKANVSPPGNPARVHKAGFTKNTEGNPDPYDDVDGQQPSEAPPQAEEWYQVSSPIGSFVRFLVRLKDPGSIGNETGAYDATATPFGPTTGRFRIATRRAAITLFAAAAKRAVYRALRGIPPRQ